MRLHTLDHHSRSLPILIALSLGAIIIIGVLALTLP